MGDECGQAGPRSAFLIACRIHWRETAAACRYHTQYMEMGAQLTIDVMICLLSSELREETRGCAAAVRGWLGIFGALRWGEALAVG